MVAATNGHGFKPCAFIPDGYTRTEKIPEDTIDGFYPSIEITFRPMTDLERSTLQAKIRANGVELAGVEKSSKLVASTIAGKLTGWNVTDPDGNEVPINPENVGRLEPHLLAVVLDVVIGARRFPDPEGNENPSGQGDAKN